MPIPFVEQHLNYIMGLRERHLVAQQVDQGYVIQIEQDGRDTMELHKQRGGVRVFKTLDSVSSLVNQTKARTYSVRLLPKKNAASPSVSPPWNRTQETREEDIPF